MFSYNITYKKDINKWVLTEGIYLGFWLIKWDIGEYDKPSDAVEQIIMKIKIKATHEDTIYHARTFIQNLERIQQREFDELFEKLKADGFCDSWSSEKEAEEFLFDYVFNCEDMIEFWDYCKEFNLEMDD